jgi:predicted DNA-binding transcriptional regulator AlpA
MKQLLAPDHDRTSCEHCRQRDSDNLTIKPPQLLLAHQAAALCFKSLRTWRAWDSAGYIPQPIRIARSLFWLADELHAWIAAGCPRRAEWEARNEE